MEESRELFGLTVQKIKFLIQLLSMYHVTDIGIIREKYRSAYDEDVSADVLQKLSNRFAKKIERTREVNRKSYKSHKLYQKKQLQDILQKVIELGLEIEVYGSSTIKIAKPDDSGFVEEKKELFRVRDLKSVNAAVKILKEIIDFDQRPSGSQKPASTEEDESDGMGGLQVVRA